MPVEASKVDLLRVQRIQRRADLRVSAQVLRVNRVRYLLPIVTRVIAGDVAGLSRAAMTCGLQMPHFQVGSVHLSPQLLVVLEVLQPDFVYVLDR